MHGVVPSFYVLTLTWDPIEVMYWRELSDKATERPP